MRKLWWVTRYAVFTSTDMASPTENPDVWIVPSNVIGPSFRAVVGVNLFDTAGEAEARAYADLDARKVVTA